MSTFTLRTPAILAMLVLTTMTGARTSYAAPSPGSPVPSSAGSAGSSQPPIAALRATGMPSSGYHALGGIPNLSAPHPPTAALVAGTLPTSVDLSQYNPPVGDQGQVGSCAAWATGYYLRGWYADRDGYYPSGPDANGGFEPMYTYAQISQGHDNGSTLAQNLNIQQQQGIDTRADYHQQGDYDYTDQPTAAEKANAANYKIAGFSDVSNGGWDEPADVDREHPGGRQSGSHHYPRLRQFLL